MPSGWEQLVFTGEKGVPLRRSNLNKALRWRELVAAIGGAESPLSRPAAYREQHARGEHTRATLRGLMLRMGHDSMRAALIDQHATQNADRYIADALAAAIEAEQLAMEDEDQASEDDYAAEGE